MEKDINIELYVRDDSLHFYDFNYAEGNTVFFEDKNYVIKSVNKISKETFDRNIIVNLTVSELKVKE